MTDDDAVSLAHDLISAHADLQVRLLKSEALNAELARMLKRLEWRGCSEEHAEECPLCLSPRWWDGEETDHNEGCELFALLKKATTE